MELDVAVHPLLFVTMQVKVPATLAVYVEEVAAEMVVPFFCHWYVMPEPVAEAVMALVSPLQMLRLPEALIEMVGNEFAVTLLPVPDNLVQPMLSVICTLYVPLDAG